MKEDKKAKKEQKVKTEKVSKKDKKVLALFTHKRYNFIAMIKKLFYPHRFRQGLFDELSVRFLFIIGKL